MKGMEEICISPHIATTFFNESAVLLDLRKNVYYALNDSAADFWKILAQKGSYELALKEFLKIYESSSADVIIQDIEQLVESLVELGLLNTGDKQKKLM